MTPSTGFLISSFFFSSMILGFSESFDFSNTLGDDPIFTTTGVICSTGSTFLSLISDLISVGDFLATSGLLTLLAYSASLIKSLDVSFIIFLVALISAFTSSLC